MLYAARARISAFLSMLSMEDSFSQPVFGQFFDI